jgi:hypothetical protein
MFRLVGGGVQLGPLGMAATDWPKGPIVPAPGDYNNGEFGGMKIGRETEILGENLPQPHSVHHKSHLTKPGQPRGKPETNRLSYGAAINYMFL